MATEQMQLAAKVTDHPAVCPWCAAPVDETYNLDGKLLGWSYVRRTYRCHTCRLTIRVDTDAVLDRARPCPDPDTT
ncbi:MAG TPA: hypothetical protein VFA83_13355 [Acidimicrobiales bacterium]|nr:hypothetical protein [Acidimicrobiales bacterium]